MLATAILERLSPRGGQGNLGLRLGFNLQELAG